MAYPPLKLAILISGRGSNMKALLDACRDPEFPAETTLVISSHREAPGLKIARNYGIPTAVAHRPDYETKAAFEAELLSVLIPSRPDLICLAGFMHLLSPKFVDRYSQKIINIHPSLLPSYKGLNTHKRVLAAGETETGCTVHYVTAAMDEGPVILQKTVTVKNGDTPEKLARRVLEKEHEAYPEAVKKIYNSQNRPQTV